ncbi:3-oxoacyl-ACP synthase III family protein [Amycolatopsis keratiniphila]|uniref:3-oxoacyl-ACP synthase n=1 Tax=Amycolatopsis keratiniphila subsp. keratiniphila TaxID=227715 RepID=A0A1W2LY82_9PSEU|nr:ketoacyl-ACP synthase III [Amycolatopsis keratiniphila]OLZ48646.1 3-oxoacyl-ACP synthase [Amycolatopsis keratiniphila subsp. nogabecina]ONF71602.1 3-oxoacyl-ACP synthase [Amycolatopsis keratiniphila subsp. keratiniphila]SDU35797.1 3-oxoacyl-[acyl-carrier-protein] synthase III [Amycolatopsis keratiniphila]
MRYGIIGTGSYLPRSVVTNEMLAPRTGVTAEWIAERTGISERRFAASGQATSDLAAEAAKRALEAADLPAELLDFVVVGTSTPDFPQPATAVVVQSAVGADRAAAFDVNSVCTSFVYALDTARGLLTADSNARYALVIGADIYSRQLDFGDHRSAVLFGDGAGAVVLGPTGEEHGMLTSRLVSDGRLQEFVKVAGGGSRNPLTPASLAAGEGLFTMQGRAVREYVETVVPDLLGTLLKEADLGIDDIDLVVPHQANAVLLRNTFTAAGVPPEKLHLTCQVYGNTAAASIPVTLDDAIRTRGIERDALIVLLGIGGGMSAGASLHRWAGSGAGFGAP